MKRAVTHTFAVPVHVHPVSLEEALAGQCRVRAAKIWILVGLQI